MAQFEFVAGDQVIVDPHGDRRESDRFTIGKVYEVIDCPDGYGPGVRGDHGGSTLGYISMGGFLPAFVMADANSFWGSDIGTKWIAGKVYAVDARGRVTSEDGDDCWTATGGFLKARKEPEVIRPFKVGDKVRFVGGHDVSTGMAVGTVCEVVHLLSDRPSMEIQEPGKDHTWRWPNRDDGRLEIVAAEPDMAGPFEVGDEVLCINGGSGVVEGRVYKVTGPGFLGLIDLDGATSGPVHPSCFVLASSCGSCTAPQADTPAERFITFVQENYADESPELQEMLHDIAREVFGKDIEFTPETITVTPAVVRVV